jgi:outer membrane receptor protein involved in Fe transport
LTASYEIPTGNDKLRLRLFGTVENLFDYEYFENGFRTAGRTARGGLSVAF